MFGHLFRNPEEHLRDVWQIHIELHRQGMKDFGLSWDSMMFAELLFATFLSGGFHPFATEKWHDLNAAQDVAWVNTTWFLQSELFMLRQQWRPKAAARENKAEL